MHGVDAVTRVFAGGAKAARLALVDGLPGAVVSVGGRPMAVFDFTVRGGRVVGIELLADPETLGALEVAPVPSEPNQILLRIPSNVEREAASVTKLPRAVLKR